MRCWQLLGRQLWLVRPGTSHCLCYAHTLPSRRTLFGFGSKEPDATADLAKSQQRETETADKNESQTPVQADSPGALSDHRRDDEALAVEKKSVARGLFINKIDKDRAMVFPEFQNWDDVKELEEYAADVSRKFDEAVAVDSTHIDKRALRPDVALEEMAKTGVYGMSIPIEYGGVALTRKHECRVYEVLGRDMNVFANVHQTSQLFGSLLAKFGSEAQKQKWLPRVADGSLRVAIAIQEHEHGIDLTSAETTAFPHETLDQIEVAGRKKLVMNARDADVFLVLAKHSSGLSKLLDESHDTLEEDKEALLDLFLVDAAEHADRIQVGERRELIGLRACEFYDVQFNSLRLHESDRLGGVGLGLESMMDLYESTQHTFGAAVIGLVRPILDMLIKHCNANKKFGIRLSELSVAVDRVTDLSLGLYALESMVYYVAGCMDEMPTHKTMDIENFMIQRAAYDLLQTALQTCVHLLGPSAALKDHEFNMHLRNAMSITAFMVEQDTLSNWIAMAGTTTWLDNWIDNMNVFQRKLHNPLQEALMVRKLDSTYGVPELTHNLFELVHPSLEQAVRLTEECLARVEVVTQFLWTTHSQCQPANAPNVLQSLDEQHLVLNRLCSVVSDLFASLVCMSRASRAYAIGLKYCEEETLMAHTVAIECTRSARMRLETIIDRELIEKEADDWRQRMSRLILEEGGYPFSNPLDNVEAVSEEERKKAPGYYVFAMRDAEVFNSKPEFFETFKIRKPRTMRKEEEKRRIEAWEDEKERLAQRKDKAIAEG